LPQNVCIFEDKKFSNFFPLSLSQPVFQLRVGFGTLSARMQDQFAGAQLSFITREYLAGVTRLALPGCPVNEPIEDGTLFINGRLICFDDELKEILNQIGDNSIAVKGGYVVAARLEKASATKFAVYISARIGTESMDQLCDVLRGFAEAGLNTEEPRRPDPLRSTEAGEGTYEDETVVGKDNLEEKLPVALTDLIKSHRIKSIDLPEARLLSFPWQLIEFNRDVITDDFKRLPFRGQSEESIVFPAVQMINEDDIVIGEGAVIKSGVVLDASDGPIAIGDGTVVYPNASIIGPVSIGKNSRIKTGAKILEGTAIGDVCKVGGEVEGTIIGSYSNKQHDGFIGHSYLGEWVNIGAASNNSDLKNNDSSVRMWNAGKMKEIGRQFMGLLMADHTKTGINTVFNTGTVVGFNCNIFSSEMPDKFVPSYSWGHGVEMLEYDLTKAMQTAEVVMERREIKFDDAHRRVFEKIHEFAQRCQRNI